MPCNSLPPQLASHAWYFFSPTCPSFSYDSGPNYNRQIIRWADLILKNPQLIINWIWRRMRTAPTYLCVHQTQTYLPSLTSLTELDMSLATYTSDHHICFCPSCQVLGLIKFEEWVKRIAWRGRDANTMMLASDHAGIIRFRAKLVVSTPSCAMDP